MTPQQVPGPAKAIVLGLVVMGALLGFYAGEDDRSLTFVLLAGGAMGIGAAGLLWFTFTQKK